ncbi:MAG: class I SAM-dependent methyltransferase [Phycisphaerae bacterium]
MFSHIDRALNELVQRMPDPGEGFITAGQAEFLWAFIRLIRPRIVAETGLNAGHSACVILRAMETYGGGMLMSFDIGRHDATQQAADLIKERYPDFHYIRGDTKETLAGTMAQALGSNHDATLDLAIVDGGHDIETARNDLLVFDALLKPGGFLWLDDFGNATSVCVGVDIVGREFAASRGSCHRLLAPDHRGMMIYQKGF